MGYHNDVIICKTAHPLNSIHCIANSTHLSVQEPVSYLWSSGGFYSTSKPRTSLWIILLHISMYIMCKEREACWLLDIFHKSSPSHTWIVSYCADARLVTYFLMAVHTVSLLIAIFCVQLRPSSLNLLLFISHWLKIFMQCIFSRYSQQSGKPVVCA